MYESLSNLTILYVEDEKGTVDELSYYFESVFKKVYIAYDGEEGLEKFKYLNSKNIDIDIIISDINMPKKNGISMVKDIKSIDNNITFIFTTAYSDSDYLLEAIDLGVVSYLIKPIDIDKLFIKIEKFVKLNKDNKLVKELIDKINSFENVNYKEIFEYLDKNITTQKEKCNLGKKYIYDTLIKSVVYEKTIIRLTNQEILLLELFLEKKDEILNYEILINHISLINDSTIENLRMLIKSLRNKIYKELIINIPKIGYKINISD
jgi:DNA-binding response OmpR family regulator